MRVHNRQERTPVRRYACVVQVSLLCAFAACSPGSTGLNGPIQAAPPIEEVVCDRSITFPTIDGQTNFEQFVAAFDSADNEVRLTQIGALIDAHGKNMLWMIAENDGTAMSGALGYMVSGFSGNRGPWLKIEGLPMSLSPDGRLIAYISQRSDPPSPVSLRLMNSDGTEDTEIVSGINDRARMTFSPDGKHLAFFALGSKDEPDTLEVIDIPPLRNASGGVIGIKKLATSARLDAASGSRVAWSSTNVIAFCDSLRICTVLTDGADKRFIDIGYLEEWSPDGRTLAYSRFAVVSSDIFVTSDFGATKIQLTNTSDVDESDAHWSRDGTKVLVTAHPFPRHDSDGSLEEINVRTKKVTTLRTGGYDFGRYVQK